MANRAEQTWVVPTLRDDGHTWDQAMPSSARILRAGHRHRSSRGRGHWRLDGLRIVHESFAPASAFWNLLGFESVAAQ